MAQPEEEIRLREEWFKKFSRSEIPFTASDALFGSMVRPMTYIVPIFLLCFCLWRTVCWFNERWLLSKVPSPLDEECEDLYKLDFSEERTEMDKNFDELEGDSTKIDALRRKIVEHAMKVLQKITPVQKEQQSVNLAINKGYLPAEIQTSFMAAIEIINVEIGLIQEDANSVVPGWGQSVMGDATRWLHAIKLEKEKKERSIRLRVRQLQAQNAAKAADSAAASAPTEPKKAKKLSGPKRRSRRGR
eukprot:89248_1